MYSNNPKLAVARFEPREQRNPGSVAEAALANPAYQGRRRLAEKRRTFVKENGYPFRYQALLTTKATSDDERDPNLSIKNKCPVYFIKKRPERSAEAEVFIRKLEGQMEAVAKSKGRRGGGVEHLRVVPPLGEQKDTSFPALPTKMPIDYYDPSYYNSLPPRLRVDCATKSVALLPDPTQSFSNNPDERLGDSAFQKKYGASVLERYDFIDSAALKAAIAAAEADAAVQESEGSEDEVNESYDEEEDEEEDDGYGEEDEYNEEGHVGEATAEYEADLDAYLDEDVSMLPAEEVEDISARRTRLAATLSMVIDS
ncbi:hypothetical protein DFP72DRAFT_843226 [Ephemerocybe angulata]|uniref:Uncharacterized protein n=1 Tax=Ephemerocybe angulata TaxID=980116 RepID=A0A8H6M9K6_9AGAR|nr:hypothetical protein DFP72DRAFT_843226 [Tulosesus angulatus]